MNTKVKKITLYGMLVISTSMLFQVDDREQPDIPAPSAPSYYFNNSHIPLEVISNGAVAGITPAYGINGYRLVI